MHGIIFLALEDFLEARLGEEVWPRALQLAHLEDQQFDPDRYYPDETAGELFVVAAQLLQLPLVKTLELFGRHMSPGLVTMGRSMGILHKEWKTLDILEHLQSHVLAPFANIESGVTPPDIRTYRLKHGEVAVAYISRRKLCHLMKGIISGLGEFFQEPIAFKEQVCMSQDAPLCRLSVYLDDPFYSRYVDIEREFGLIQSRIAEITFFNSYQGAPFSEPGLVMRYAKEDVLIQVPPMQLIAMQEERLTYISVPHLAQGLKAMVREVDLKQGFATLATIRLTDGAVGCRRSVRVMPEKPIAARMKLGKRLLRGTLLNLSTGGARILLEKESRLPEVLLFEPVLVEFSLPLKYVELGDTIELGPPVLELDGNILDVSPLMGSMAVRVVFSILARRDNMMVEQYAGVIQQAALESLQNRMVKLAH
ncbi:MAG: heme NO-binding domain-containing protein [Magnetococcales bacterium]|nr:heme NO-binding domain-containing protein [Magnetococcales bacterium]